MTVRLRASLLVCGTAVASAAWLNTSKTSAALSSFGSICDSTEAWTKLTVNPTVSGVQNIKFSKIQAINQQQLEDFDDKIKLKEAEVESLEPKIAEARAKEAIKTVDETTMVKFIKKALEPFQGKEQESKCGDPKLGVVTVRGAFAKAQAAFPSVVAEFLASVLFDEALFVDKFSEIVPTEGPWCDRFGQRLRNAAVAGAMKPVVAKLAELLDQKAQLEGELVRLKEKKDHCKSDIENIAAFEGAMGEQKKVYVLREDELMEAEEQLYESQAALGILDNRLLEEEAKMEEVLEELKKHGEKMAQAKTDLEDMQTSDQNVKNTLAVVSGELKDVTDKLTAAKTADKVIEELRDAVSVTTLKMRLLFVEAALKPVRENGLSGNTQIDKVFFQNVNSIPGGDAVQKAADDLTSFCSEEALPAFAQVKDPDLSTLCPTADSGMIMDAVTNSIVERAESVKKLLHKVQTWFDPYKGQHSSKVEFTKEKADSNVDMGEPEGLREIVGVFAKSKFYQYLKGWTVEGNFLPLIAKLAKIMDDLSTALESLKGKAAELKAQSAIVDKKLQKAQATLQQATAAAKLPSERKLALEEEMATLMENKAKQLKTTEDFEKAVELAMKRLEEAEKSMVESYKVYHSHQKQALLQEASIFTRAVS